MSETLLLGLVLQGISIGLLIVVFKRSVFRRIGPYFVFGAFVYHGLTEIVQALTGEPSSYRVYAQTNAIDTWTVVAGCAMLLFAIAYAFVLTANTSAGERETQTDLDVDRVVRILDWRLLAMICVPLIAVVGTSAFRPGDQSGLKPTATPALVGLAQQFLVIALALTTISFIITHKGNVVLPLLVQLGIMTLVGSRLEVLVAAVTTLFGLAILHRTPSARQIVTTIAIVAAMAFAITGARNGVGRSQLAATDLAERVQVLAGGALSAIQGEEPLYSRQQQPLGERLDGNSFPAAILTAESGGRDPVGLTTARNDLLLAVPSFVNPDKLSTNVESRSEKAYLNAYLGVGIRGDFLPTQLGSMLGWFGPIGLMFLAGLMGLAVGVAERVLRSRLTPSRLILTLALFGCVMRYESGMETWSLGFRGALLLVAFVFLADRVRGHRRRNEKVATRGRT